MKSLKLQLQIGSLFQTISERQRQISSYRKNLLSLVGFTPLYAFSLISQGTNEKYITVKEIFDFLRDNEHYKTEKEVAAFIKFKSSQELRLSYNEFTHLVGSHPKQVAQVSFEVQSTQRNRIRSQLSGFLSLLVEANTIIRKLKKDISSNNDLDYYELQELLDPNHSDNISFESLRLFMEDCGRSLQRGDFEQIREHLAPNTISDRMKYKDLLNFLSNKQVTSVVVHHRKHSESRSPSASPSRDRTYNDLSFQSSSSSFYRSAGKSVAFQTLPQQPAFDQRFSTIKQQPFTESYYQQTSPQTFKHNHTNSSTVFDSISPKHLSASQSSVSFASSASKNQKRIIEYPQVQDTTLQNTSQSFRTSRVNPLMNSTQQQVASPTKNKQYDPSLFKDPLLRRTNHPVTDQQLNATIENLNRIRTGSRTPKKSDKSLFDTRSSNLNMSKDNFYQQSLSPNRSRIATETSRIEQYSFQAEQTAEKIKSTANYVVGFLSLLKELGQIEETIEDNKKKLTRATKFSPLSIFRHFDHEGKGYLRLSNFLELIAGFDVRLQEQDGKLLFARIEKNHDGFISQQEFIDIFRPEDADYQDLFEHKYQPSTLKQSNPLWFDEVKFAKQLIVTMVEREKRIRKSLDQLRRTRDFDRYTLFSTLYENNDGLIASAELATTLRAYNVLLKQSTHRLVFNLLDKSHSGTIQYADFLEFISQ